MEFLRSIGSNVTTIANAYNKRVYAFTTSRKLEIEHIKIVIKHRQAVIAETEGQVEVEIENNKVQEKFNIPSGTIHRLDRPIEISDRYITLVYKTGRDGDGDGETESIVENYRIPVNYSYIITAKGGLVRQAYGDPNRWKEQGTGVDHNPN